MEIHAYSQDYLGDAQNCMGEAFDFGMVTLEYSSKDFTAFFLNSDVVHQVERGNPKYISGMNGCELMRLILEQSGIHREEPDVIYVDKSPEYWAGWSLTFYQWYSLRSFEETLTAVPLDQILGMYETFHEMDLMQFADALEQAVRESGKEKTLRWFRNVQDMTQEELSEMSGVPLQEIQEMESGEAEINQASGKTLYRLSRILDCDMEDLLEKGKALRE